MFDEWRRRRELKKQIATLKKDEAEVWAGFVPEEPGDKPPMPPRLQAKLYLYGRELDELETERLLRKAYRRAIKITSQANW